MPHGPENRPPSWLFRSRPMAPEGGYGPPWMDALVFTATFIFVTLAADLAIVRAAERLMVPSLGLCLALAAMSGVAAGLHATGFRLRPGAAVITVALGGVTLIYAALVGQVLDSSPDGPMYHIPAVLDLLAGWAPGRGPGPNFWANVYPSGAWTWQATLAGVLGSVEAGKGLWLPFTLGTVLCGVAAVADVRRAMSPFKVCVVIAIVASPVVATQWLSHYNDGLVHLGSAALLFALGLVGGSYKVAGRYLTFALVIVLINTKMVGLFWSGTLVAGWIVYHTLAEGGGGLSWAWIMARFRFGLLMLGAAAVATLLVGYRPYVTNVLDHGMVVYPPSEIILSGQRPANLDDKSPPVQLLHLMFGQTGCKQRAPVHFKAPGTFTRAELMGLTVDTRCGGFGPFYSLQLVLGVLAFAALARGGARGGPGWRHPKRLFLPFFGLWVVLVSTTFPEAWWARYMPLIWAVPLLLLLGAPAHGGARLGRLVALACLAAASLNVLQGVAVSAYLAYARPADAKLHSLEGAPSVTLVPTMPSHSNYHIRDQVTWRHRLEQAGIPTTVDKAATCPEPIVLTPRVSACVDGPSDPPG